MGTLESGFLSHLFFSPSLFLWVLCPPLVHAPSQSYVPFSLVMWPCPQPCTPLSLYAPLGCFPTLFLVPHSPPSPLLSTCTCLSPTVCASIMASPVGPSRWPPPHIKWRIHSCLFHFLLRIRACNYWRSCLVDSHRSTRAHFHLVPIFPLWSFF
jgi:hypothetical protein